LRAALKPLMRGSGKMRDHHVAHGGVVLQRVGRHVLAVAGLLDAAMRHLVGQHEVGVDPGAAVLQPRGRGHRAADILGPHRRGEAVVAVIGPGDRLVDIGEAGDRDHRAEHLAAHDLVLLQRAGDDGRLVIEAAAPPCLPPVVISMCLSSEARSTKEATRSRWRFRDQRPDLVLRVVLLVVLDGRDADD
jgi:hypothetical protein